MQKNYAILHKTGVDVLTGVFYGKNKEGGAFLGGARHT